ncbi:dipicolinate synthase subunit DpsA [Rhodoplanes elegans]|uniref:dipicolinate synthase subunit DpsA n=1 Tax=Rhodoplanes elegans TaxID=29408 RepID=UPI001FDFAF35|nr:dipicolinate synthase subunit DpsA [Rhodoplanes elegans]
MAIIDWSKLVIGMLGGDRREQEIARLAALTGAEVRAHGLPWPEGGIPGVKHLDDPAAVLRGAKFALFPIPGIAPSGALFAPAAASAIIPDRAMLAGMAPRAHIVLGWADANLKAHADALGIGLHEYEWDRALMLERTPAILEGLLKIVIENTDTTIHNSEACVVGQGTIGTVLARYLVALGARTHVVARNPEQRAAAFVAGATAHGLEALPELAPRLDLLFSTVPSRVVGANVIGMLPDHALIVDLAAPPGGVDFETAKRLGRKAIWGRGLGSRAPVTVGASQWRGIRARIEKILQDEH